MGNCSSQQYQSISVPRNVQLVAGSSMATQSIEEKKSKIPKSPTTNDIDEMLNIDKMIGSNKNSHELNMSISNLKTAIAESVEMYIAGVKCRLLLLIVEKFSKCNNLEINWYKIMNAFINGYTLPGRKGTSFHYTCISTLFNKVSYREIKDDERKIKSCMMKALQSSNIRVVTWGIRVLVIKYKYTIGQLLQIIIVKTSVTIFPQAFDLIALSVKSHKYSLCVLKYSLAHGMMGGIKLGNKRNAVSKLMTKHNGARLSSKQVDEIFELVPNDPKPNGHIQFDVNKAKASSPRYHQFVIVDNYQTAAAAATTESILDSDVDDDDEKDERSDNPLIK